MGAIKKKKNLKKNKGIAPTVLINIWQPLSYLYSSQNDWLCWPWERKRRDVLSSLTIVSSLRERKEDRKRRSRRKGDGGLKLRKLLRAPRCVRGGGWPGKVKVVPHQSLPYAPREMDPTGHFLFLFLISSFQRWRSGREGGGGGEMDGGSALKMDGPGVTQEQRGFNVKIKACYLRLQGLLFFFFSFCRSLTHSLTFLFFLPPPPHLCSILSFQRFGVRER